MRARTGEVSGNGSSRAGLILYALRATLVASFVAGFFLSQGYSYLLYSLLGVIAAVIWLDPVEKLSVRGIALRGRPPISVAR